MPEGSLSIPAVAGDLASLFEKVITLIETSVEAVAHPLGFQFLTLRSAPDGAYLRLHLWQQSRARVVPHAHSSAQESLILAGKIRNTIWLPDPAGKGPGAPMFAVLKDEAGGSGRRYVPMGRINATPERGRLLGAGDRYQVPQGMFHTTECLSPLAATLVARAGSAETHAIIIGRPGRTELHYPRTSLSRGQVERFVELLRRERELLP